MFAQKQYGSPAHWSIGDSSTGRAPSVPPLPPGLRIEVARYTDLRCRPGTVFSVRSGDYHTLNYIYAGEGIYSLDRIPYQVRRGDLFYAPGRSQKDLAVSRDGPLHVHSLHVRCASPAGAVAELPLAPLTHVGVEPEILSMFSGLNRLWLGGNAETALELQGLATQIVGRLHRAARGAGHGCTSPRIRRVIRAIADRLHCRVTVKELAREACVHPVYLASEFRRETGETIKSYTNRLRVQKAQELLLDGECNVSEAAYQCGFSDVHYFSRTFKRIAGVTPSALRLRSR